MNLKMLFVINDEEKKLNKICSKYKLSFNTLVHADGTASEGILNFLGLRKTEKNLLLSIISSYEEKEIIIYLKNEFKINEIGKGIAFTVPLSSSSKYVLETFQEKKGEKMEKESKYHLIITIANEGYADIIMNVAKRNGANGGTLIKGRGIGGKGSFKLFNVTVEPEKDIILIVCTNEEKNKIMKAILDKNGINTESKGICFSLPIDAAVGIDE